MASGKTQLLPDEKGDSVMPQGNDGSILPEVDSEQKLRNPDDVPPPYSASNAGFQTVDCEVCKTKLYITENRETVRCSKCSEYTALKPAPPGKRYTRCSCGSLLLCSTDASLVYCSRTSCGKKIYLSPIPSQSDAPAISHPQRMDCSYCHCLVTAVNRTTACESCHSRHSSRRYAKREILSLTVTILTITIIILVVLAVHPTSGLPVVWSALSFPFMIARIIFLLCKNAERPQYETL